LSIPLIQNLRNITLRAYNLSETTKADTLLFNFKIEARKVKKQREVMNKPKRRRPQDLRLISSKRNKALFPYHEPVEFHI
jgi:hypothetical protein